MAAVGTIQQFKGPFSPNQVLDISGHCKIGISIAEKDYMKLAKVRYVPTQDTQYNSFTKYLIQKPTIQEDVYVYSQVVLTEEQKKEVNPSEEGYYELQPISNFAVNINEEDIEIGRTFIYETSKAVDNNINTVIKFPNGAPLSTIVDIVYSQN